MPPDECKATTNVTATGHIRRLLPFVGPTSASALRVLKHMIERRLHVQATKRELAAGIFNGRPGLLKDRQHRFGKVRAILLPIVVRLFDGLAQQQHRSAQDRVRGRRR